MAAARQEQAEIQRRHRLERRQWPWRRPITDTRLISSLVARHEISQGAEALPPQRPLQSAGRILPINTALPENQPQLPRRGRPPLSTGLSTDEDSPLESENPTRLPRRGRPPLSEEGRWSASQSFSKPTATEF
ncbi:hypothetical protein V8E54_003912 [Elaphomyces granulatus]